MPGPPTHPPNTMAAPVALIHDECPPAQPPQAAGIPPTHRVVVRRHHHVGPRRAAGALGPDAALPQGFAIGAIATVRDGPQGGGPPGQLRHPVVYQRGGDDQKEGALALGVQVAEQADC